MIICSVCILPIAMDEEFVSPPHEPKQMNPLHEKCYSGPPLKAYLMTPARESVIEANSVKEVNPNG